RGARRPRGALGRGHPRDLPHQCRRSLPDDPGLRSRAEGSARLRGEPVVGGRASRHRLLGRLRRIEGRARHHDPLARAGARPRSAPERGRAGVRAHAVADRGARRRRRGRAGAALRRARAAQGRGRGAGRRRDDRLADRGRAARHRPDRLRRRRHAHRRAALSFDYIIVGAGSAGCVLANRLTEDPRCRVLLLEAGPRDTDRWIHVPLGYGKLFARTDINWAYESEPEPALNGRRVFTPRGKVLGGSSSINGLVYIRGQPEDFDGWGIAGWDFDSLAPHFARAEAELKVSCLERHELCDAFIASAASLGIPLNREGFNGSSQEGTGYYHATCHRGRRRSAAVAYLRPAERRSNLSVEVNALATRILFDGKRAHGVQFVQRGSLRKASAAAEVLLCGGSFNSPQLLELSGVGAGEKLRRHQIPVVCD